MHRPRVPDGFAPLPEAAERFGISRNALRLSARRRLVRTLTVRNKVYVNEADLAELYAPRPYPPVAA